MWYAIKRMYNTHIVLKLVLTIIMFSAFFWRGFFLIYVVLESIVRFKDHKKLRYVLGA